VKVHKDARNDQIKIKDYTIKSKADKLEEISQLILILLKLLVSMPKSEAEREKLKYHLKSYTINFENKTLKKKQINTLAEGIRGLQRI
jgi:adenylate cyclase